MEGERGGGSEREGVRTRRRRRGTALGGGGELPAPSRPIRPSLQHRQQPPSQSAPSTVSTHLVLDVVRVGALGAQARRLCLLCRHLALIHAQLLGQAPHHARLHLERPPVRLGHGGVLWGCCWRKRCGLQRRRRSGRAVGGGSGGGAAARFSTGHRRPRSQQQLSAPVQSQQQSLHKQPRSCLGHNEWRRLSFDCAERNQWCGAVGREQQRGDRRMAALRPRQRSCRHGGGAAAATSLLAARSRPPSTLSMLTC